jgi:polyisoprenyl-phosphate glycosyltransferase
MPINISIVVPCYNEEANVVALTEVVTAQMEILEPSYEIIFIDNNSTDGTVKLLRELCERNSRVRVIMNNRNYGQMRSPAYGIFQASGRAVIAMSADFQDPPPALLGEFIDRWRAGAKIVLGVRESKQKLPAWLRAARGLYYAFLSRFADYRVVPNAPGFGLYDRDVLDCISKWREPEPFFRGMLVESGFPLETIAYPLPERFAGRSKNNFATLLSFALSSLASSSKQLLRLPFYAAAIAAVIEALLLLAAAVAAARGASAAGWLIAALVEANFILLFAFLGLIGEQVRLISERTRNTPLVIEKGRINF